MADDARISTAIRNHPKTRKLQKRADKAGVLSLIWLFLYAAESRSDGDLQGMTDEDIELAADWSGTDGEFVKALVEVRFIDGEQGAYRIHDWAEHNPFAATKQKRVEAAKEANRIRWERERCAPPVQTVSESDAHRTEPDSPPHHTTPLNPTPQKTRSKAKAGASAFVLPEWIDVKVWADFEEMRQKIGKKLTDGARQRIVDKLGGWRAGGHTPDLILGASIENGWAGVWQPKSFFGGNGNGSADRAIETAAEAKRIIARLDHRAAVGTV